MSNDDTKLGPDDIARIAAERNELQRAAQSIFSDMGKVQRLASNRTPAELRDEASACILALIVHHTVNARIAQAMLLDTARDRASSEEAVEKSLDLVDEYTMDREKLSIARDLIGCVNVNYEAPTPEEMEEVHFSCFQQPTTEDNDE